MSSDKHEILREKAKTIRQEILKMIHGAGSGHSGGALSTADIITCLYFSELHVKPENPNWAGRDRFILSKGHGCAALYAALALRGFFPEAEFSTFRQTGSILQGHPDMGKTPGVEMNTGALGLGICAATGMALAARHLKSDTRVYVLMSDGEMDEGSVWEAAMFAANYGLDNLVGIIDRNKIQCEDFTCKIMPLEPLRDKWHSFGWHTIEIDGHDIGQILQSFAEARSTKGKPSVIIAHTTKGKGVSFMENQPKWHGTTAPTESELRTALRELEDELVTY